MVQDRPGEDNIERAIREWQAFGKLLYDLNRQRCFRREPSDCARTDDRARIRFERSNRKSFTCKRVAGDAASGANVSAAPLRPCKSGETACHSLLRK